LGSGLEGGGLGGSLISRFYELPRQRLIEALDEAIRNPQIARDLMMAAKPGAGDRFSPATRLWMRTLLAVEPAGQMANTFTLPPPPPPVAQQPAGASP
jgi:hypothetical protein